MTHAYQEGFQRLRCATLAVFGAEHSAGGVDGGDRLTSTKAELSRGDA
jgi:hypothetical protein